MSSNYPPGVTGREYEIAGPDSETDEESTCRFCGAVAMETVYTYGREAWFTCSGCGKQNDLDPETLVWLDGPDPDEMYDRMRDERDA